MSEHQPSLFSAAELKGCYSVTPAAGSEIGLAALRDWKQRIWQYQQQVRAQIPMQQGNLLEPDSFESASLDPDLIDPLTLPRQNTEFWRWKADDMGVSALYFVIDYELPILLYVGETVKSNQRWKGEHGCKRYLLNYRQVHYQHNLASTLGIGFWAEAPTQTRPRQRLERALIQKWRSPFNKENWQFWATPFVGSV
jgi:hypothetical protein